MKYLVTKLTKQIVPQGKQNAGQNYVEVTIEDPEDGEERVVPVFDKEAERYIALIPTAVVGTPVPLPDTAPDNLKMWQNCFDQEFIFPEPMVRVDAQGKPQLNKFNQMYIRKSVIVMVRKKRDNETNELSIRKGWDLATRGTSVMNAFYMPLRNFANTQQAQDADAMQQIANGTADLQV